MTGEQVLHKIFWGKGKTLDSFVYLVKLIR